MNKYGWAILIPCVFIGFGCNVFSPLDSPKGDAELLEAARACFDHKDYSCASAKYLELEQTSKSSSILDQAYSEEAFEILSQNGLTFSVFMDTAEDSHSSAGKFISTLAGVLRTSSKANPLNDSSHSVRMAIFNAYQKNLKLSKGANQGLVKFITATALMAAILGEDATGVDIPNGIGKLKQSDIASNPQVCLNTLGHGQLVGCDPPSDATIIDGSSTIDLTQATSSDLSGPPTLEMVLACANEISAGINLMSASGGIGSNELSFANSLISLTIGTPSGSPLFRYTLLSLGIGLK